MITLASLFPFYWMIVLSLDKKSQVFVIPPNFAPSFNWAIYGRAWSMAGWGAAFANTIFIAGVTITIALITSILAGYAFGSMKFPGRDVIFVMMLGVLMIPPEALLIPNYVILYDFHLLDTYAAQILPYGTSVFGIFLIRQFFLSLPKEYWEAAQIDGCSTLQYLWRVGAPLCRPALITVAVYLLIGVWNSFEWPLIVTQTTAIQPIEVAMANFISNFGVDWRRLAAASTFTTFPVIFFFLLVQRYLIAGVAASGGAIKG